MRAGRRHQQRVAVRRRFGREVGADRAAGTGLVVDDHLLAQLLGELLRERAPNQGPTIASASIQIHAVPLRLAAAQARAWLVDRAAARLGVAPGDLEVSDGVAAVRGDPSRRASYADLVAGAHVELALDAGARVKTPAEHRLVGRSVPRVDIPAKATGGDVYVHDVRVPGMLHGRVVRPPYVGLDAGDFVGDSLASIDESSAMSS